MACCCSTSPRAFRRTRRCSARSGSTARRRRATPERSIRSPRAFFRFASARRPSSRRCCSTRRRSTSRPCISARRRPPATPRARSCGLPTWRSRRRSSNRRWRVSSDRPFRCRRRSRRSSSGAARTTSTRAPEPRSPGRPRDRDHGHRARRLVAAFRRAADRLQQGHVHSGPRGGHCRRARLAAPISPRCGGRSPDRFRSPDAVTLEALRGNGPPRRATGACCRPTPRCPASPGSTSTRRTAQALVAGRIGRLAAGRFRHVPLLRTRGSIRGLIECGGRGAASRCVSRARTTCAEPTRLRTGSLAIES